MDQVDGCLRMGIRHRSSDLHLHTVYVILMKQTAVWFLTNTLLFQCTITVLPTLATSLTCLLFPSE
jgi:hypothetical protein